MARTKNANKPPKRAKTAGESSRQHDEGEAHPRLTLEEIDALRSTVKPINVKWVKGKSRELLVHPPSACNLMLFLNRHAESYFENLPHTTKKIARTKICGFYSFPGNYDSINDDFAFQGWAKLWLTPFTHYDDNVIKMFYSNMWIEYDVSHKPVALNSFINGRRFQWTPNRICELLRIQSGGFDDLACTKWDNNKLGISLADVKNFLGMGPSVATTSMSAETRLVLFIVSYCICGKEAKLPSNLDQFIAYKILKRELVNFGAIFIACLIDAITLPGKNFVLGNLIVQCLLSDGLPNGEVSLVSHPDVFDRGNIDQMIRIRRTVSSKGKEPASTSQPDDIFDDAEAENLATGIQEEDQDDDHSDSPSRFDQPVTWRQVSEEVGDQLFDVKNDITALKGDMKKVVKENEALRDENSKLKKSVKKLKNLIKELIPNTCFSSDEEN